MPISAQPDDSLFRRDFSSIFGQRKAAPNKEVQSSWLRSLAEHKLDPDRVIEPEVLTFDELKERRAPVEELSSLCLPEIDRLLHRVMEHAEVVMLSDAQGVVIEYRSTASSIDKYSGLRVLPGSIWTEDRQGTTGVGLCLREQRPLSVVQDEHFSSRLSALSCTVAPIFGNEGQLACVLNVTSMQNTGHAVQSMIRELVASSARRIENLYFDRRHANRRVLRLSRYSDFLDGAAEARLALDDQGRIVDATPFASKLLVNKDGTGMVNELFGKKFSAVSGVVDLDRAIERDGSAIRVSDRTLHFKLSEPSQPRFHSRTAAKSLPPLAATVSTSRAGVPAELSMIDLVGTDPQVAEQLKLAQRVYARHLPLLLQGESGVGKTLLAKTLHEQGPHRGGNFVSINCAAIPHDLIESELFGYRPGSFTGAAKQGSPGRLIAADGGTLFLDEIGDMPLSLQARLLQVLSEGEFVPVGGVEPVKVRFALITATLRDLPPLVQEGKFREDLFFRINGASLYLPPLRARADRARLIEEAFWSAAAQAHQPMCDLTSEAMAMLMAYGWPGNMRELQHVAKFALAISETSTIEASSLPAALRPQGMSKQTSGQSLKVRRDADIVAVLNRESWNISAAAKKLGISRSTLHRRILELNLERPKHAS